MNILNVEKVSKTFGEKVLLDKVTLGINKGDKVGVCLLYTSPSPRD